MFRPIPVLFDTARAIWFRAASTLSMSGGAGAINLSVRPVAQPSRRRVPAPSRCEDDAGGETPPALAGGTPALRPKLLIALWKNLLRQRRAQGSLSSNDPVMNQLSVACCGFRETRLTRRH